MKIRSRPQLDAAQEAQLAFIKLLKLVHKNNRNASGVGLVQLSFRATHTEIETVAVFEGGHPVVHVAQLDNLDYIPKDL